MNATRFEPYGHDFPGLWKVSSSLDWCERNYVITWFIAEFWNSVSSLVISFFGALNLAQSFAHKLEMRFALASLGCIFVGLGSAAFHGSLTYIGQLGDELPMVYVVMILFFILSTMNKRKLPRILVPCLVGYSAIFSVIHTFGAFTIIFQIHFAVLVLTGLGYMLTFSKQYKKYSDVPLLVRMYVGSFIVAFIFWLSDQLFCEKLHSLELNLLGNTFFLPNPQFHSMWHVLTGYAIHVGLSFVRVIRFIVVYGQPPKIQWKWKFFPLLDDKARTAKEA
jgi:dihydroceramidase